MNRSGLFGEPFFMIIRTVPSMQADRTSQGCAHNAWLPLRKSHESPPERWLPHERLQEDEIPSHRLHLPGLPFRKVFPYPEVIVARHAGIRVFGVSVVSSAPHDTAADYFIDGEEVIKAAAEAAGKLTVLFTKLIESL